MTPQELCAAFKHRQRSALAKIITHVESDAPASRLYADEVLALLEKPAKPSIRIAISGPPGVGKSTFINTLGQKLLEYNFKIAILPIDPASELSFGSILADKTRMASLLGRPDVYIRPSSSRGILGGINAAMSDVIFVVESFGFDLVIIETVGVGQSEALAYTLVDHFVVLLQPASGDFLQAIKKGILERADFILVNKADTELQDQAKQSLEALSQGLPQHIYLSAISALTGMGIDNFLKNLLTKHAHKIDTHSLLKERKRRFEGFFNFALQERLWPKVLEKISPIMPLSEILEQVDQAAQGEKALGPMLDYLCDNIIRKLGYKNYK
jgi:LAO/AO transport system kinase